MKRFILTSLFAFLSLLLVFGSLVAGLFAPGRQAAGKVEIKIERGEPFSSVVRKLKDKSVIANERIFSIWAWLNGLDKRVHWGFYRFELPLASAAALDQMIPGRGFFYRITIPEGLTLREAAELLAKGGVVDKERLLRDADDPGLLSELRLEEGGGIEGYLFPDTYQFPRWITEREVLISMVEQFRAAFSAAMEEQTKTMGFTVHEVVTLASVIEKETGTEAERPLVSAVFHNRLKLMMPLQSDPTVIYAVQGTKSITRKDLRTDSPYNTYRVKGLPPGPICNPGLASLKAALSPAAVPYLYFVSKNDGSHLFSVDLKEHNQAVKLYQRAGR